MINCRSHRVLITDQMSRIWGKVMMTQTRPQQCVVLLQVAGPKANN